jgi:hypothetical protein
LHAETAILFAWIFSKTNDIEITRLRRAATAPEVSRQATHSFGELLPSVAHGLGVVGSAL